MHSSRIPIIHNFGIVSKKIADTLIEEFEEKEDTYRIPSPSPNMPSSPRLKGTPTNPFQHTPIKRDKYVELIPSKFIQDYNKSLDEIEKTPSKHNLHRKLEDALRITERKLNTNHYTENTQIGEHWKDLLFMYQCQGPLQIRSLAALLNSLTSQPLLNSPHHLFTVLHMTPLELRDLLSPIEKDVTSRFDSPNNFKQSNNLLKTIYLSQILQTGYSRLYLHYILGRLENYENLALVITVLQSSLTSELLTLSESSHFVWLCIKHAISVLSYLSINIDIDSTIDPLAANHDPPIFSLNMSLDEKSIGDSAKTDSIDSSDQLSPEIFHTLDIWHKIAFCHSQNLKNCILRFIKCYISNQQSQSIFEFTFMLDILSLMALNNSQIAEILFLLPILHAYSTNTDRTFKTEQEFIINWSSYSEMLDKIVGFYNENLFTFQWEIEYICYYIHSMTKLCLQTKISYIRRLCLTGKISNIKSNYHFQLGLIDLSSYRDDASIDISTKIRYLAVKGIKDLLTSYNNQISTELAPLGIREITLHICRHCLESENCQSINFLLNHYRPCTSILLTSSKEFLQTTLMIIHNSFMKLSNSVTNPSKSMTSSLSSMSKSSKRFDKNLLSFHSLPKTPSKETKNKIHIEAIRNNPHSNTSSVRNELKMRNISYEVWKKKCEQNSENLDD
ncbi:hypothetical protein LOD99_13449 [Oopsacas minuta]|uniref:Uncharacterized protein n=1 Tax=Oopsacas minuta TaxID=111878 RepID=A0AAV7KKW2_9METZ|nr:hypothetical protein LOD99_13449 [Oopsacas minuta]